MGVAWNRVSSLILSFSFSPPRLPSAQNEILKSTVSSNDKKTKGRTGWPQHVWALELKQ